MSNKRKVLTVTEKVAIIRDSEKGMKNKVICNKYGLSSSTVSTLLKNREPFLRAYARNITTSKRLKKCQKADLDDVLFRWYVFQNNSGLPTNCLTMRNQAKVFASQLGYNDFSCTNGWLHRFRTRHNILPLKKRDKTLLENNHKSAMSLDYMQLYPPIKCEESESSVLSPVQFGDNAKNTNETPELCSFHISELHATDLKRTEIYPSSDLKNTPSAPMGLDGLHTSSNEGKFLDEIKKRVSQELESSMVQLPEEMHETRVTSNEPDAETEMLVQLKQEEEADNNCVAKTVQNQSLPLHALATNCVETLQCIFESVNQQDNAVFDALNVIRLRLSNLKHSDER